MPDDIDFTRGRDPRRDPGRGPRHRRAPGRARRLHLRRVRAALSELLGLAFAIIILIVAFGSVLAMGLPVGVALFGIGLGTAIITVLSNVLTIPDFATFLGIMIGLGVGIDYALLVVTRYRRAAPRRPHGAGVRRHRLDTAGRSVLFAGTTVVISLLGMLLMGVTFVQGLAVGAAAVVAITVAASLTLLPAFLGFAGERIERNAVAGLIAAGLVAVALVGRPRLRADDRPAAGPRGDHRRVLLGAAQAGGAPPAAQALDQTTAYRWSRIIQRRPWASALVGVLVLVLLALPTLSLRLGFSDESNYAEETSTKQACTTCWSTASAPGSTARCC